MSSLLTNRCRMCLLYCNLVIEKHHMPFVMLEYPLLTSGSYLILILFENNIGT